MSLGDLSVEQLLGAVVVALVVVECYSKVMSARKAKREYDAEKQLPTKTLTERVDAHDRMLDSDKRRIEALEQGHVELKASMKETDEKLNLLVRSQLALISHEVNGNSIDKLKESQTEITDWLTGKR